MRSRRRTRVFFTLDFPPKEGGIAEWSVQMARGLARMGERVVVFCRKKVLADGSFYRTEPFRVVSMGGRNWAGLKHFYLLYYTLKVRVICGPATIYAAHWELGVVPSMLSCLLRFNVVTTAHGWEITKKGGRRRRILERYALRHANLILAVSQYTRDRVLEAGGRPDRLRVVSNGVDTRKFHPAPRREDLMARFGLHGRRVLLTLSRIVERKGHDRVIEALPRVSERIPQVCYLIGGRGDYQRVLEAKADRLGVRERVRFAGYVSDDLLNDFYNLAEVYVMPCRELSDQGNVEGFGITFLEAGACGLPVIGGRSGGVEDAVVDGETGVLVDPSDVDTLAQAIIRLLTDRPLARRMGEAGRKRAEGFSWDRTVRQVLDLSRHVELYP